MALPDFYGDPEPPARLPGGPGHEALTEATTRLLSALVQSDAPDGVVADAVQRLEDLSALLEPYGMPTGRRSAGGRLELPGRGHPLLMPLVIDHLGERSMRGRVTFPAGTSGHEGAVHGGFIPLLFDEALGVFPSRVLPPARTAYLHVDYRHVTPVGVEIEVRAELAQVVGRKLEVTGSLNLDGQVLVEARALFVQPNIDLHPPASVVR